MEIFNMNLLRNKFKVSKPKTEQEIIREIHDSFDRAQDELLAQAKEIIGQIESKDSDIEKGERLKALGFISSKTVKEVEVKKSKLLESKKDADLVEYYKRTYPFQKFLKVEQLNAICEKYGLIYAPVERFTEDVPSKNLNDIEIAKPLKWDDKPKNKYFVQVHKRWHDLPRDLNRILKKGFYVDDKFMPNDSNVLRYAKTHGGYKGDYSGWTISSGAGSATVTEENYGGLFIAAPENHFNLEGLKNKGLAFLSVTTQNIKDPIVFRYVRGGIQVITKWGLEAEDPELQVDIMN
jgi:hypothetical protein